jgi:hypothetical protein
VDGMSAPLVDGSRFPGLIRTFRTMAEAEVLPHFAPKEVIATRWEPPRWYVLRHRIHQAIYFKGRAAR